jgi:hypothetical protein
MATPRKKTKAAKKVAKRGGAREGSGRKSLYGEPVRPSFTARVNDAQGAAIGAWCLRNRISPATLLREVGLLRAGVASLGVGIEKAKGSAEKAVVLEGAGTFPVKCTAAQEKAIKDYCLRKKMAPATWLREAALEYIGRSELGLRGQAAALASSL